MTRDEMLAMFTEMIDRCWESGFDEGYRRKQEDLMDETSAELRDAFFGNYGNDNENALHYAYDLICYLEEKHA